MAAKTRGREGREQSEEGSKERKAKLEVVIEVKRSHKKGNRTSFSV